MPAIPNLPRGLIALASFGLALWLLSWLQAILIPIALAILLTFLLSPLVSLLERVHVGRIPAVALMIAVAFSIVVGIGWLIGRQVTELIDAYPQFEQNITAKLEALQSAQGGFIDKLQAVQERILRQIERSRLHTEAIGTAVQPLPVTVVSDNSPFQLSRLWSVLGPAMEPFAAGGLTLVLLTFMLVGREDLRDRAIRLISGGHLSLTTKALDEAGDRISRYLLTQLGINATYGLAIAIGLFFIGLPYALLWGFLTAVLRYIPYLGAWLSALLTVGVAILVSQTWTMPALVITWFLVLELVTNMLVEPMLYGRGIGVSVTATLVMVVFWAWLWGPIGFILATPLTACLVVLGKYVPALGFFDTLLGTRPALEPPVAFYQRLLARDGDEALDIAHEQLKESSLVRTFDGMLIPALASAKQDVQRTTVTEEEQRFIVAAVEEAVEELATFATAGKATVEDEQTDNVLKLRVTGCPASDHSDEVALQMLRQVLDTKSYEVALCSTASLATEVAEQVSATEAQVVCIANVPPGGIAQTRLLCVRLRARAPELKILVARWGMTDEDPRVREQLLAAGADGFATTMQETLVQLAEQRLLQGSTSS